jgi:hypothetical protein
VGEVLIGRKVASGRSTAMVAGGWREEHRWEGWELEVGGVLSERLIARGRGVYRKAGSWRKEH